MSFWGCLLKHRRFDCITDVGAVRRCDRIGEVAMRPVCAFNGPQVLATLCDRSRNGAVRADYPIIGGVREYDFHNFVLWFLTAELRAECRALLFRMLLSFA